MIRVVVVDDSAFMRKAITIMLESDPEIRVVGTARDGDEGFDRVRELKPDLVTLDIEMPRVNGLEVLDLVMKEVPTPVLVVSSVTSEGAEVTLDALDRGAVDFIPKSSSFVALDITKIKDDLIRKVKTITKRRSLSRFKMLMRARRHLLSYADSSGTVDAAELGSFDVRCVAVGVSTGGPPVVQEILSRLPSNFPAPIVIAQHMPKEFTKSFADRLNSLSKLSVKEAETGDRIVRGQVFIAQGGKHLIVRRKGFQVVGELTIHPENHPYHPSADVLILSVADVYGSSALGVILTGMGKDGVEGLKKLEERGGKIIAQNEESCIVYGMPKAAVDAGIVDAVLPVGGIVKTLQSLTNHEVN